MNGYNFTDRVRKVLRLAREEAARFHHEYVGTEHILLAIIREGDGVAVAALTNLSVDREQVRETIEATVKKGPALGAAPLDLPYTSRAKKILELSMIEARELRHSYVGTEHLLLGAIAEQKGIAAQTLSDAGVTLEAARREILLLLGEEVGVRDAQTFSAAADRCFRTAIALIELHHTRLGSYPSNLKDLQFLGESDRWMLTGLRYEKLSDGYALEIIVPPSSTLDLSYPSGFWRGLGLRRTNVAREPDTPSGGEAGGARSLT